MNVPVNNAKVVQNEKKKKGRKSEEERGWDDESGRRKIENDRVMSSYPMRACKYSLRNSFISMQFPSSGAIPQSN